MANITESFLRTVPFLQISVILFTMLFVQILINNLAKLLFPTGVANDLPNGLIPLCISLFQLGAIIVGLLISEKIVDHYSIREHFGKRRSSILQIIIVLTISLVALTIIGVLAVNLIIALN